MAKADQLPNVDQVLDTISIGRRSYVIARRELNQVSVQSTSFGQYYSEGVPKRAILKAIHTLAEGVRNDTLIPPLPVMLGEIIVDMSDRATAAEQKPVSTSDEMRMIYGADTFKSKEYREAAILAIEAAIDHGTDRTYRHGSGVEM